MLANVYAIQSQMVVKVVEIKSGAVCGRGAALDGVSQRACLRGDV